MNDKIEELKKDISELHLLQSQSSRSKVKDLLFIEERKLASELIKLQEEYLQPNDIKSTPIISKANKCYEVKVNNYAWDQTQKFVKFYVTIKNVHTIPEENVSCQFTNNSLELKVKGLENRDYVFVINKLLFAINPKTSNCKIKTDMVIINAAKVQETEWSCVTVLEKKSVDLKKPNLDEKSTDPNEGIMSLMKNMYETGDDEMKRTIAKAWTESQAKKSEL